MFKRVLLCFDGSAASRNALKRGADLAIHLGSSIYVLSVVPTEEIEPSLSASIAGHVCVAESNNDAYRKLLDESLAWLRTRGVSAEGHLASGSPIEQITRHALRLQPDLIVLGHYPRPTGGFWWSKSPGTSLAERLKCCILVASES